MRPIRDIIVYVPKAYKDELTTDIGLTLLLDQNIKQVKDTVRHGKVIAVPDDCPLDVQEGDELYFHHNIVGVTIMEDEHGDLDSGFFYDKKKRWYRVPINDPSIPSAYATVRDGVFKALEGVCFVEPIITKEIETDLYLPNNEKEVPNIGIMVHTDSYLEAQGIKAGDKVAFEKDSEYKYPIDGKMFLHKF